MFLKSLAGCKTRKGGQTGDSHVTRRGVSLCLSGWDLLTAHCLLGSHGPRDPNLREICVAFWKLIAMRNELVGGVGWGWKTRRKTRFCRNILFVRSFVRSFVMTVCKFILPTWELRVARWTWWGCSVSGPGQVRLQSRPEPEVQILGTISWLRSDQRSISGLSAEYQLSVSGYPQLLISIVTAGAKQAETARLLAPAPAIRANHRHHQYHT